jgi:hypothetical protein
MDGGVGVAGAWSAEIQSLGHEMNLDSLWLKVCNGSHGPFIDDLCWFDLSNIVIFHSYRL